jgi:hypothetical protein
MGVREMTDPNDDAAEYPGGDALLGLDDYTSGFLPEGDAASFEDALFAAAARGDAPEAAYADDLFDRVQFYVRRGGLPTTVTAEEVARLRELPGVHYIDFIANTVVGPWPDGTELIAYRVDVDLRGCDAVDVDLFSADRQHLKSFRDVAYDVRDGAIYASCHEPVAYGAFRVVPSIVRIQGKREGREAIVTELRITPG